MSGLAGNLDIAGARYVAVQIGAAHVVHELRLNIGPHTDGARGAQAHERHGEGVLAEYMRKSSDSRWAILAA